jgi:hypothetical protein
LKSTRKEEDPEGKEREDLSYAREGSGRECHG